MLSSTLMKMGRANQLDEHLRAGVAGFQEASRGDGMKSAAKTSTAPV